MDWNGDGKHDWKDEAFFHEVILKEDENSQSGSGSTEKPSNNVSNNSTTDFSIFGGVFAVALVLAIISLFTGYPGAFGSLLGIGAVVGLVLQMIFG